MTDEYNYIYIMKSDGNTLTFPAKQWSKSTSQHWIIFTFQSTFILQVVHGNLALNHITKKKEKEKKQNDTTKKKNPTELVENRLHFITLHLISSPIYSCNKSAPYGSAVSTQVTTAPETRVSSSSEKALLT